MTSAGTLPQTARPKLAWRAARRLRRQSDGHFCQQATDLPSFRASVVAFRNDHERLS